VAADRRPVGRAGGAVFPLAGFAAVVFAGAASLAARAVFRAAREGFAGATLAGVVLPRELFAAGAAGSRPAPALAAAGLAAARAALSALARAACFLAFFAEAAGADPDLRVRPASLASALALAFFLPLAMRPV